jgi:hypothetical protein
MAPFLWEGNMEGQIEMIALLADHLWSTLVAVVAALFAIRWEKLPEEVLLSCSDATFLIRPGWLATSTPTPCLRQTRSVYRARQVNPPATGMPHQQSVSWRTPQLVSVSAIVAPLTCEISRFRLPTLRFRIPNSKCHIPNSSSLFR